MNCRPRIKTAPISTCILASLLLVAHLEHGPSQVSGSPIVSGYLNGWEVPFRHNRHQVSLLRDPMPWEDGYFDPAYHSWSKDQSGPSQAGDKQSSVAKLVSDETMSGSIAGMRKPRRQ